MKVLLTGASSGIGEEMARLLAKRSDISEILLVARSTDKLESLRKEIGLDHRIFSCDLSSMTGIDKLKQHCEELSFYPDVLINNAGMGKSEEFSEHSKNDLEQMMYLNMDAVVKLCEFALPHMIKKNSGYILNVASIAAYQAMPNFSIYAATKSFVASFTRALSYEVKDSGINVTVLSPGPTRSGFLDNAGLNHLSKKISLIEMSSLSVATSGLEALFKKKREVIPGFSNRLIMNVSHLAPRCISEYLMKIVYSGK